MLLRSPLRSVLRSPLGFEDSVAWTPLMLFADGEGGAWYDPSDLSTVFQNSAGTTAGAPGSPVGRILDKSGNDLHASQATTSARPTLVRMPKTGRRNLLTYTEDLTQSVWTKIQVSVISGIEAPDGSLSAYKLEAVGYAPEIRQDITSTSNILTASLYFKKGSGANHTNTFQIRNQTTGTNILAVRINLDTGELTYLVGSTGAVAENIGNGWWRLAITTDVISGNIYRYGILGGYPEELGNYSYIWHPQIEKGTDVTDYQRVNSAFDVHEDGVPDVWYWQGDGTDDKLTLTLASAFTGYLFIAGTKGSILEPVSFSAGAVDLGPLTYTGGTPGIFNAIGGIVGVVLLDRALTEDEQTELIAYYKGKGAKGLLVEGPELNTTGLDGFTLGNGWAQGDGVITRSGQTAGSQISKSIFASVDTTSRSYLFKVDASARSGDFTVAVSSPGIDQAALSAGTGTLKAVVGATANRSNMGITGVGAATITASSISVKELRAEEDWA